MRVLAAAVVAAALITSGAALAQQQQPQQQRPVRNTGTCAHAHPVPCYASDGTPIDHGPNTPQANSAYMGGGVVLQGAPGAPAPDPSNPANLPPAR